MKKIILGVLILFSLNSFCQKNDFKVLSTEKTFGKNLFNNSEIRGVEYVFPDRIESTYLDTISGFLTVQLRGITENGKWLKNYGNILLYDLNEKKLKWNKKIDYVNSSLQQFSKTMVYTTVNKSFCLDIENGDEIWKVKNDIYFVDPEYNIGIGYKFKNLSGSTEELQGINLKNGDVIWNKEISREYGWNNVFFTNDSTLIIVAAGLHSINLKTGKGWDYNTITGKKDYSETIMTNVAGAALGVFTGVGVLSTGHNLVRDVVSNVIVDSLNLYFSSKEQLAMIDKNSGEVKWSYSFPKDLPSKSSIFIDENLVFMINKGYAFMGNRQLNFGKPFIAAFDKVTGEPKYLTLMNVKDDPILGFNILDNEIYLVFKNWISKYSQETGDLLLEVELPEDKFGELKNFIGKHVYVTKENGELSSLSQSDTTKVYVFTNKNEIISIDKQLNVAKIKDSKDLIFKYFQTKDYKFFSKDKLTLIIDNEGKKVAEIEASSSAFLIGKTLFDKHKESFSAIDLAEIMNEE